MKSSFSGAAAVNRKYKPLNLTSNYTLTAAELTENLVVTCPSSSGIEITLPAITADMEGDVVSFYQYGNYLNMKNLNTSGLNYSNDGFPVDPVQYLYLPLEWPYHTSGWLRN